MFETVPPPLRFAKLWITIGWVLVGYVIFESLRPDPPSFDAVPDWDKWGHTIAYMVLMLWFAQIYLRRSQRIEIGMALLGLGIAIEFAQRETGYRTFEYLDMVADGVGVLIGYGLSWTPLGRSVRYAESLLS